MKSEDSIPEQDRELLARLGRIARVVDPVPDLVFELARSAFELRDLDAELAAVVGDPALDLALVRGPELNEMLLEFAASDLSLQLEISRVGDHRALLGQVQSGQTNADLSIYAESSSGRRTPPARVDQFGRFELPELPSGAIRLRCDRPGLRSVVTAWIPSASADA